MAKENQSASGSVGVGDFVAPGLEIIGAFSSPDATFGAKGGAIGGGIGAGIGAAVGGPAGAAIGKALGSTVGQLIGGGKDKRLATERMSSTMARKYGQLNLSYNANPYGEGSTFYAEDGLVLPGVGDKVRVNIEKDELLVDPSTMSVVQKFDTKRYKRHNKDKGKEHSGNFIEMDPSQVIIPRKKAKAFQEGDRISRRSIIAQIMEDQDTNGVEMNDESVYAQDGYAWLGKLTKDKIKAQQNYLVGKGAPIKVDGVYGPKTAAAVKQYGLMPELGVSPIKSSPKALDISALTNFGLPKADDINVPLLSDNPELDYVSIPKPVIAPATFEKALNSLTPPSVEMNPEFASRNPNVIEELGLSNLSVDVNPVKAARAMNFLPTAVGMVQAGQNDPFLQYDENAQTDTAKAMIAQLPEDINIEASRAAIAQGQAGYLKAMRNVNSPAARAEVADFMLKSQTQAGMLEQDKANKKADRVAQKLGMLADIEQKQGTERLQARNKFALESSQDRAVRQNMIQAGISEGVTNYAKMVMDDEKVKAVNAALKYNKAIPGTIEGIIEDSDAVNAQIMLQSNSILPGLFPNQENVTTIQSEKKDRVGMPAGSTRTTIKRPVRKNYTGYGLPQ